MKKYNENDEVVRGNLGRFYSLVDMPGGYTFDHVETLNENNRLFNGQFKKGHYDSSGNRKFFTQVIRPAIEVARKFVDVDTKDVNTYPDFEGQELKVWMMQRKLRFWLKENKFGTTMNDVVDEYPKGHVVIKKSKSGWKKVSIENLRMVPSVQFLEDSPFVYEFLRMGRGEIEAMNWDGAPELLKDGDDEFILYECYEKEGMKWRRRIISDPQKIKEKVNEFGVETLMADEEYEPSILLDERMVKDLPYRELKWEDVPGRWLGLGFIELLRDNQIAFNETDNLERKGLALKALQLWQTRDDALGGTNALSNLENGTILKTDSEVNIVQKDNSDLSAFNSTRANLRENIEKNTFSSDITTGANLPSRTPGVVANLQGQMAASFFDKKRENLGLFFTYLILDDIIPDFKNGTRAAHTHTILASDKDAEQFDKLVADMYVEEESLKRTMASGYYPSDDVREDLRQRIIKKRGKGHRFANVPEGFYDNAKYWLTVDITGEAIDTGAKQNMIQTAMQIISTNPNTLKDKATRQMFFWMLSLGGISPYEMGIDVEDFNNINPQVAGSLSAGNGQASSMPTSQTMQ